MRTRRVKSVVLAATVVALGFLVLTGQASAASGYFVTIAARDCPQYSDIYANKARNDVVESLRDLGLNSQYGNSGALVGPAYEDLFPQTNCKPLPGWRFTLGTGYQTRAVSGVWGSLSKVTGPYNTSIVTQDSTPLLDNRGDPVGSQTIAGAVTIKLTDAQATQASKSSSLWLQGGTPDDPVLASHGFGSPQAPQYGFGTLRCATDNVNGDNVEYVFFPSGTNHVFCYAYYVSPPPTSGTIIIRKQVAGAPAGANPSFPFNGDLSFDLNGFALKNGGSISFYRAGGQTWSVTEGSVAGYTLDSIKCTSAAGTSMSTRNRETRTVSIDLTAGDTVDCTFFNRFVPPTGTLTITKITEGGVGSFRFGVDPTEGGGGTLVTATTTRDGIPADAGPVDRLDKLQPGKYTISELRTTSPAGGWTLTNVECNGTSRNTRDVTVMVEAGKHEVCTFTNKLQPGGAIHLSKVTEGGIGRSAFVIESLGAEPVQYHQDALTNRIGVPADAIPNGESNSTDHVYLGSYRIIEQAPLNAPGSEWMLTSVTCDGVDVPFSDGATVIRLSRGNPHASCRFTNTLQRRPAPDPEPHEPGEPTPPTAEPPATVPGDPERPGHGAITPGPTGPVGAFPGPSTGPTKPEGERPMPGNMWANIAVASRPVPALVRSGDRVLDRVAVTDRGPSDAEGVMLDYQAPKGTRLVGVRTAKARCTHALPLTCRLGVLKPHQKITLAVALVPAMRSGVFRVHAVMGSMSYDPQLSNNLVNERVHVEPALPQPPRNPVGCASRFAPLAHVAC